MMTRELTVSVAWGDESSAKTTSRNDVEMAVARPVPTNLASTNGNLYLEQRKAGDAAKLELESVGVDSAEASSAELEEESERSCSCSCSAFSTFMFFWEAAMIVLFFFFVEYDPTNLGGTPNPATTVETVQTLYPFFQDVHVMIFVGFGFLMTFLRRNGYSSVGLNLLVAAMAIQWYILTSTFWDLVFKTTSNTWEKVRVSIPSLIKADFSAAAVLITYGAVLGKVSPLQLCVITFLEVIFFSLNEAIGIEFKIADIGGAMVIHMFGAFFGLACSWVLGAKKAKDHPDNAPAYHADLFSMIGTIFLWMYWPSFNGALAVGNTQQRAIFNTLISLTASCMTTFISSAFFRGNKKFDMVDIQNATLAGGVAMGTCADMIITPGGAIAIGAAAGIISTWGFSFATPFFENKLKIHDTCGVLNLHGLPGIAGAVAGIIAARLATASDYNVSLSLVFPGRDTRGPTAQAIAQLEFMFITLGIAIVSGLITGVVVAQNRLFNPIERDDMFNDSSFFKTPAEEIPFYFGPETQTHVVPTTKAQDLEARLYVLEKAVSAIGNGPADRNRDDRMEQLVERIVMKLAAFQLNNNRKHD